MVATKRLHTYKQTCRFELQVWLGVYDLLVDTKQLRVKIADK